MRMPADMSVENGEIDQSKLASQKQEAERLSRESRFGNGERRQYYRQYDVLKDHDYSGIPEDLSKEKREVKEALQGEILGPYWTLSTKLRHVVEAASAKKNLYSAENDLERTGYNQANLCEQLDFAKEGENEALLTTALSEVTIGESSEVIFNWSLPYLSMAWSGMDSLRLISDRGMQLPMSDLSVFFSGPVSSDLAELQESYPQVFDTLSFPRNVQVDSTDHPDTAGTKEAEVRKEKEIFMETFAHYSSESYFWNQIRGEMNTYNPAFGEKLDISKTMQKFVAGFSKTRMGIKENGEDEIRENGIPSKPKQSTEIKIYLFTDPQTGRITQIPQTEDGNGFLGNFDPALVTTETVYINNLDYFNKMKSENERRWVVATTAAMCVCNARKRLDSLNCDDIEKLSKKESLTEEEQKIIQKYDSLVKDVNYVANNILNNYDLLGKKRMGERIAKSAFDMSYAISFGSFSVADWGWSYDWSRGGNKTEGYTWKVIGAQGDPTASGDAFTARRPYFHEALYAGVKGRASAMNSGVLMPVDPEEANNLTNELLSDAEAMNRRGVMIEKIKKGEQPHLAKFFGVIGAYETQLGNNKAWQEGSALREKEHKQVNDNLKKAVEDSVIFVPTIFPGQDGKKLFYPMLAPQFQISLFDMLTVSKDASVGDVLRKTWKKDGNGKWVEASPKEGGVRRTLEDIDWKQYPAYGDDSRAVNDNFISQLYAPLYGVINPKSVDAIVSNPLAALTSVIKSVDIGTRRYAKKAEDGTPIKKESFEVMYASTILFQNLAFGHYSVIGRGGVQRFAGFLEDIAPKQKSEGRTDNLYTSLRSTLDVLQTKGEYEHYSDSFYLMLLAMSKALAPIVVSSEKIAKSTTGRMSEVKTTGYRAFRDPNEEWFRTD